MLEPYDTKIRKYTWEKNSASVMGPRLLEKKIFILKTELLVHNVLQFFTLQIPFQVI